MLASVKELQYIKCSPSHNVTILVFTEIDRQKHPIVANYLMDLLPDVEQVGFIEKPNDQRAIARLQMMGGEFCGNALRSLAWIAKKKNWKGTEFNIFLLEASGADKLLQVENLGQKVRVEHPIKRELNSVRKFNDMFIVELVGITHIIIYQSPPDNAEEEAMEYIRRLNLSNTKAVGILYTQMLGNKISMVPIVWVQKTNRPMKESACASGTQAIITAKVWEERKSSNLEIIQPSGDVILGSVEFDNKKNCFEKAFTEGRVYVLVEEKINIMNL
jgi:diaminopimelate epimerase